ncbi:MAG: hypothetical protein HQK89_15960 [Nitrospirae bacterium]|nr:hypothetical protein [Nitrospirota bacterium]
MIKKSICKSLVWIFPIVILFTAANVNAANLNIIKENSIQESSKKGNSTAANVSTTTLDINKRSLKPGIPVEYTNIWSWALAISTVANYFQNVIFAECQVLAEYGFRNGGSGLCCGVPQECIVAGKSYEMEDVLENVFKIPTHHEEGVVTLDTIAAEIAAGRPLIAVLRKTGEKDHPVVVYGYERPGKVSVFDTLYGSYEVKYDKLLKDWQYGQWKKTLTFSAKRADSPGCKRVLDQVTIQVPCATAQKCNQLNLRTRYECN